MTLSGKAKLAGIVGWPVTHSLSPVLHGHWLAEYGIDGAMVPLAAKAEDFSLVIDGIRRAGFQGVNVTVPHKEAAFAIAHRVDAAAKSAGAANLLVFHGGEIEARNTDSIGLAESLKENIGALNGAEVVLLGAGGAARGAILGLEMLGAGKIHLLNRDPHRAKTLAASLAREVRGTIEPGGLGEWKRAAAGAALVVNSTSAGMGTSSLFLGLASFLFSLFSSQLTLGLFLLFFSLILFSFFIFFSFSFSFSFFSFSLISFSLTTIGISFY